MKHFLTSLRVSILVLLCALGAFAEELKLEDVIAKHLAALGPEDVRSSIHNRIMTGLSDFTATLPARKGMGKAIIVSDKEDLFFLMSLNSKEYPFEKIGYFKDKISLPWITAGIRGPLGAFVAEHPKLLSDGLFMGSTSSRWVLLDPKRSGGKLSLAGIKKVNGHKAYSIEYFTSDGASSEIKIRIYIDAETFQHIRTEYHHEVSPKDEKMKSGLGQMGGVSLELTEDFDDFRPTNGLTLPFSYKAKFLTASTSGTYEFGWGIKADKYLVNQNLASDFFTFEIK